MVTFCFHNIIKYNLPDLQKYSNLHSFPKSTSLSGAAADVKATKLSDWVVCLRLSCQLLLLESKKTG